MNISSTYAGFGLDQVRDAIEQHGNRITGATKIKPAAESTDIKLPLLAELIKGFLVLTLGFRQTGAKIFSVSCGFVMFYKYKPFVDFLSTNRELFHACGQAQSWTSILDR